MVLMMTGHDRNIEDHSFLMRAFNQRDVLFLTDHGEQDLFEGLRVNVMNDPLVQKMSRFMPKWLALALILYYLGLVKKNVVYVTFGNQKSIYLLMFLQILFKKVIKPKPHIIFDCLWDRGDGFMRTMVVKLRAALVNHGISKCIVYGEKDIEKFNRELGIDFEKLVFVHYHHTLTGFNGVQQEGDYIFSGGTPGRDYKVLMEVCNGLLIPLKIATKNQEVIDNGKNNDLFEIRPTTSEEFRRWMAGCRLVVMPFEKEIARTVGHQTFLNAMMMGKAIIIYNEEFAYGYIQNGSTGVVVPYGDVEELKIKISELYHSKAHRTMLGMRARKWVIDKGLDQTQWVYKVYNIAAGEYYQAS